MEPALRDKDRVLVLRAYPAKFLKRGQIAVFDFGQFLETGYSDYLIKRVVGLYGDRFAIPRDEKVLGKQHPLIAASQDGKQYRVWEIPQNHFFVKSDSLGVDSFRIGPVPSSCLVGVVIMRLKHTRGIPH